MMLALILFWSAVAIIAYTYIGFPLLVLLRSRVAPRPVASGDVTPSVSLVIAAHNEEDSIGGKLENVLAMDYPAEQLEILVASDGSTDRTEQIVRGFAARGVRLLALPRLGKARALNAAIAVARGEVLAFSDANSMFERQALRRLVSPLADDTVGGVAGDQRYDLPDRGDTNGCGERSYWNFDRLMKRAESRAGHVISATGAIYAIRRKLFQAVPEGVTDDFVTSTRVIAQGYRLVFCGDAVAWEPVAPSQQAEFSRKVRVITRGFRSLLVMRSLLNPFRHGFYSLQLLSHKLLRRLMFLPLSVLLIGSFLLWQDGMLYRAAASAQAAFYALAACGTVASNRQWRTTKLFAVPAYFCMVNLASLIALWRLATGHAVVVWEPQRHDPAVRSAEPRDENQREREQPQPMQQAPGLRTVGEIEGVA